MKNTDQNPRLATSYRLKTVPLEKSVVGAYQKIENAVVGAYQSIEDRFVERFLEPVDEAPADGCDDARSGNSAGGTADTQPNETR